MNQHIIDKYRIKLENVVVNFSGFGKETKKSISTNNSHLTSFLEGSWRNPEDINELLLPDIIGAINGVESEVENGSETIVILIYQDNVNFYPEYGELFSIPTLDFKEIVVGWRDFLLTHPLDGTRV